MSYDFSDSRKDEIFEAFTKIYNQGGSRDRWDIVSSMFPEFKEKTGENARCWHKDEAKRRGIKLSAKSKTKGTPLNNNTENETYEIYEDGTYTSDKIIEICEEEKKSPERLLELHGLDPAEYKLKHVINNLWHAQVSAKFGGGHQVQYQSKITASPIDKNEFTVKYIREWFEDFKPINLAKDIKPKQYDKDGLVLEFPLVDFHIANDSFLHHEMTLIEKVQYTVNDIKEQIKNYKFKKILLISYGDYFHYDNVKVQTTKNTQLNSNVTFDVMYKDGCNLMVWIVDQLREIAPIELIIIPGNHDKSITYPFQLNMATYYQNVDSVEVDVNPLPRRYRQIGNVLLGMSHGDLRGNNQFTWLQEEARHLWSQTKWSYIHSGHLHHEKVITKNNVTIEHLSNIGDCDQWTYEQAYLDGKIGTKVFLWHETLGKRGTFESWI